MIYLILGPFIFWKLNFLDKRFHRQYLELKNTKSEFKKKVKYSQDWFLYNIKHLSRIILNLN